MNKEDYINQQIADIKKEIREKPVDASLYNDIGIGYMLLGRYDDSLMELKRAVSLEPKNYSYLYNLGNAHAEKEEFEFAIKYYHEALDIKADHIPALNNMADCYEAIGMLEKAFEIFSYTTKIAPDNALTHFNLGNFLLRNNRHIEAVKCYKRSVEIENTFTDAYHNIAWILKEAGALNESEKYAKTGLKTDPEHSDLRKLLSEVQNQLG